MGKVLKIIGIVFAVLILLVLVAGIYFYNFHVFKTVRVCIGEGVDSQLPCEVTDDCLAMVNGLDIDVTNYPEFVRGKLEEVFDEAIYCDKSCFVRDIRGVNSESQELEMLESCYAGETEIVIEIRGKEGIEILKWLREQKA